MDTKPIVIGDVQPSLSFVNIEKGVVQADIWNELKQGLWREFSVENYLNNNSIGEVNQNKWLPIFPNYKVVNPGFRWDKATQTIVADLYQPDVYPNATLNTFLSTTERYFSQFAGKKIGVHLSGGLDSSLIIALLRHFNIPFVAIGLCSHRFEFRTERIIQQVMSEYADESLLLDMDDYPFYGNLDKKPKHQIPDSNIKMLDASFALAQEFKSRGCQVVFSGQGGDTLLAESMKYTETFDGYNIGNEFTFPWEQDFVYRPMGMELHSFFSDKGVIDQIASLRIGQNEDPLKIWARAFFSSLLPRELTQFTYCADFFGYSMDGLQQAKPTFKLLFEEAYDYLQHPLFSPKGINQILNTDILTLEYKTYCEFCSKLSIAVWIHSLFRNDTRDYFCKR